MSIRKHAALIHAWADGAVIQFFNRDRGKWVDVDDNMPCWSAGALYRVKPETRTIKFRNYLHEGSIKVHLARTAIPPPGDMQWVGDWQSVEVEIE